MVSPPSNKIGGPFSRKRFSWQMEGIFFFGGMDKFMVGAGSFMIRSCQGSYTYAFFSNLEAVSCKSENFLHEGIYTSRLSPDQSI